MDDFKQAYKDIENLINKVLSNLGLTENIGEAKSNLFLSVYLNFAKQVFDAPENNELLNKIKNLNENLSYEEFEKVVNEGKSHLQANTSDLISIFKNSAQTALQDFITEIEPKLAPEKIAELRKIITS